MGVFIPYLPRYRSSDLLDLVVYAFRLNHRRLDTPYNLYYDCRKIYRHLIDFHQLILRQEYDRRDRRFDRGGHINIL
jgi:hypothetical protein